MMLMMAVDGRVYSQQKHFLTNTSRPVNYFISNMFG